jgi:chemotaxis regulatin CheY-phosphate phosphatase CheZ
MPEHAQDGTSPAQSHVRQPSLAQAYAALEQLLRASPRGRWFLAEFARRNRSAETDMLLEAIGRIEKALAKPHTRHATSANVFAELVDMSEAIARTRREIAQIKPPHQFDRQLTSATEELDHIVEATEGATSDILQAAEEIQEVAWILREKGTDIELCDKIDQRATDIYTACSFQDITGQRTEKVVKALRFIEQRINAMIEIWGVDDIAFKVDEIASQMKDFAETVRDDAQLLQGPQLRGKGLAQDEVDTMMLGRDQRAVGSAPPSFAESEPSRPKVVSESAPEAGGFEPPEALTFGALSAVKRSALFG